MASPKERPYLWLFGLIALVGFVTDQTSKYVVFTKLYPPALPIEIVVNMFELRVHYTGITDPGDEPLSFLRTISGPLLPHVNRGALFGIGNDEDGGYNHVFMGISILAACFILGWAQRPIVAQDRLLTSALGLILGGTFGNLYDRIVFGGVRDFLHAFWFDRTDPHKNWPDFNIADCCLVCGALMLLVHSFFFHEDKKPEPEQTAATAAEVTISTSPAEATLPATTTSAPNAG